MCLAGDSVADVLKISSVEDLRSVIKKFLGTLPTTGELTEADKTALTNYGMRAFTVSSLELFLSVARDMPFRIGCILTDSLSGSRVLDVQTSKTVAVGATTVQAVFPDSEGLGDPPELRLQRHH